MNKLLISLALATIALAGCIQNGDGEKIGMVVRINKHGAVCPTNEVEIVRGGLSNGSGAVGGIFDATVEDPALLQKLKDAMEHQQEVKITFTQEVLTICRSNSHDYFIKSVELVNTPAPATNGLSPAPVARRPRDAIIDQLLATQAELLKQLAGK